jgi:hypothetical protein
MSFDMGFRAHCEAQSRRFTRRKTAMNDETLRMLTDEELDEVSGGGAATLVYLTVNPGSHSTMQIINDGSASIFKVNGPQANHTQRIN